MSISIGRQSRYVNLVNERVDEPVERVNSASERVNSASERVNLASERASSASERLIAAQDERDESVGEVHSYRGTAIGRWVSSHLEDAKHAEGAQRGETDAAPPNRKQLEHAHKHDDKVKHVERVREVKPPPEAHQLRHQLQKEHQRED
eukprot:1194388-Prorocentrum_minimum.AAC.2